MIVYTTSRREGHCGGRARRLRIETAQGSDDALYYVRQLGTNRVLFEISTRTAIHKKQFRGPWRPRSCPRH